MSMQLLCCVAQQSRLQYPGSLRNAYFGVNIGYINYSFSSAQLEPGFTATNVTVPHTAVRIVLYGRPINKYLSASITYMRPVNWVEYQDINGDKKKHSVWMNIAGLTLNAQAPVNKKISLSAEAGLAIITRNGFEINNMPVIKNANYCTGLFGAGVQYHLNKKWSLQISSAWSPENKKVKQPATLFIGAGFSYHLRPLPEDKLQHNKRDAYSFPKSLLTAGYTTNTMGYTVNDAVSKGPVPVFWGGKVHVSKGLSVGYQQNIFHTRKVFAMDWAAHAGFWQTRDSGENFFTLSLNPVLRFYAFRSNKTDLFFEYSVAGPAFISKKKLDNVLQGKRFTFHDFMGVGLFTGNRKKLHAGIRIAHYSNGNLFPENEGVKIPLTFSLGYVLQ